MLNQHNTEFELNLNFKDREIKIIEMIDDVDGRGYSIKLCIHFLVGKMGEFLCTLNVRDILWTRCTYWRFADMSIEPIAENNNRENGERTRIESFSNFFLFLSRVRAGLFRREWCGARNYLRETQEY